MRVDYKRNEQNCAILLSTVAWQLAAALLLACCQAMWTAPIIHGMHQCKLSYFANQFLNPSTTQHSSCSFCKACTLMELGFSCDYSIGSLHAINVPFLFSSFQRGPNPSFSSGLVLSLFFTSFASLVIRCWSASGLAEACTKNRARKKRWGCMIGWKEGGEGTVEWGMELSTNSWTYGGSAGSRLLHWIFKLWEAFFIAWRTRNWGLIAGVPWNWFFMISFMCTRISPCDVYGLAVITCRQCSFSVTMRNLAMTIEIDNMTTRTAAGALFRSLPWIHVVDSH